MREGGKNHLGKENIVYIFGKSNEGAPISKNIGHISGIVYEGDEIKISIWPILKKVMIAKKKNHSWQFSICWNKLVFFFVMFIYLPKITVFSESDANQMRALGRKKACILLVIPGLNLLRCSSKTEKKHSGLSYRHFNIYMYVIIVCSIFNVVILLRDIWLDYMSLVLHISVYVVRCFILGHTYYQETHGRWTNAGLMLVYRPRHWPNIKPLINSYNAEICL